MALGGLAASFVLFDGAGESMASSDRDQPRVSDLTCVGGRETSADPGVSAGYDLEGDERSVEVGHSGTEVDPGSPPECTPVAEVR